ncbi:hypothetical protein Gasu2_58300 [Galdieria sulphuraria]|uniref:Large ribosomal subunit protein uL15/eL18 domain-containing protein n=1 Tax=Galdieria sulphuraria TaxID=130081 RepID=M2WV64_GALSU|nr:hypothetical protein Gasu_46650 isoform 1 [Galdieria sulphuraria]EME27845.1 hypothetical protein isoform 1 [Galdieria sulphuraria]GJD11703.1 hypothetical protein Gasu2_58300 [Galdieria sulphuraria]|eukprot:XP_005704365.1 hypothetical protein isoform 1 [Galdieria sulphuraria]
MFWNVVPKYKRRHVSLRKRTSKKKKTSSKEPKRRVPSKKPKQGFYFENNSYVATKNLLQNEKNQVPLGAVIQLIRKGVFQVDHVITLEQLKSAGLLSRKSRQVCLVGRCTRIPFPIRIECTCVTYSAWKCISACGGEVICLFLSPLYLQAYLFAKEWNISKDFVGQVVQSQKWSKQYPNRNAFHIPFICLKRTHQLMAPNVITYSQPIGLQGLEFLHDDYCRDILWDDCIKLSIERIR